ncbi:MAG: hypothetical protein ABI333_19605 [bacterium]
MDEQLLGKLERAVGRIARAEDQDAAFGRALDFLMEAAGADMGAVFTPAGKSLRLTLGRNLNQTLSKKPPLLERGAWSQATFVRTPGSTGVVVELGRLARLEGNDSWASIPIGHRDAFFGIVLVVVRDLVGFSAQALELFSIIGRVLGLTLHGIGRGPSPLRAS